MKKVIASNGISENVKKLVNSKEFQLTPAFVNLFSSLEGYIADSIIQDAVNADIVGGDDPVHDERLNFVISDWAFDTTKKIFGLFLSNKLTKDMVDIFDELRLEENGAVVAQPLIKAINDWYDKNEG